ncbi:coatomer subunit zeta-1-like isoform X2 [Oncorhynchus clarkii lewisi]|uniref:coatomer subunit zeta-1-like isoform X2 n=1 Tax=Oncorhynchus clarkii lewisi TaxID=490388 RepID=UPI0039B8359E
MDTEPSLYTVKAVLILDNDGERLYAKYYDDTYPSVKEQKAFEKNIFSKTHRTDSEIALLEGLTVVYKSNIDLFFYVVGSSHENELMLMAVLNCLFDSLSQMLRKNVERRALLENMEGLFLAVDEIVDGGVILESDPQQVVHRVALRGEDVPYSEQTVTQLQSSLVTPWYFENSASQTGSDSQLKQGLHLLVNVPKHIPEVNTLHREVVGSHLWCLGLERKVVWEGLCSGRVVHLIQGNVNDYRAKTPTDIPSLSMRWIGDNMNILF